MEWLCSPSLPRSIAQDAKFGIRAWLSGEQFFTGTCCRKAREDLGGCDKVGYLNTRGERSIKPQFDEAYDFSDGLAAVNQGGKMSW
jgi:hypothetical protein